MTTYVANDVAENLICSCIVSRGDPSTNYGSWNHHRILGPQGCVPVENMQLPAAILIPAVSEAIKVCKERAGRLFSSMQPSGQNTSFADGVHGQNHGLRRLTEYFVGVTTHLFFYFLFLFFLFYYFVF